MSEQQEAGLDCDPVEVYRSIGTLTRTVHEALRQLGLDRAIEGAVASLPDARDRLNYIARISGEAAEKVIGQVEGAKANRPRWRLTPSGFAGDSSAIRLPRLPAVSS